MELKEIIKILKKEKKLIIFVVVIFLGGALVFSLLKKSYFEVNFSLLISQITTQDTQEFKYDTYYALKTADKIGDFVLGQLKSPEVVATVLKEADFANFAEIKNNKYLTHFFKAYKSSPQSINVKFRLKDPKKAGLIIERVNTGLNQNWQKVYQAGERDAKYQIKNTPPLIIYKKPAVVSFLAGGLLLGIIFGIFAALFKRGLSP